MRSETIREARKEALRFVARCTELLNRTQEENQTGTWLITGTKESGAVRRASMDLTRVLSRLRDNR